jgi:hypothetical protein
VVCGWRRAQVMMQVVRMMGSWCQIAHALDTPGLS